MAIQAETTVKGVTLPAAYHRISRIFGGKDEGWTALVDVHACAQKCGALEQYGVHIDYVADQNPYPLLYAQIKSNTSGADC